MFVDGVRAQHKILEHPGRVGVNFVGFAEKMVRPHFQTCFVGLFVFTVCVFVKTGISHSRSVDLFLLLAKRTPCMFTKTCRVQRAHRDLTEEKRLSVSACRALCLKVTGRAMRRKSHRRKRCAYVSVIFLGCQPDFMHTLTLIDVWPLCLCLCR